MKTQLTLLLALIFSLSYSQIQIGSDIDGESTDDETGTSVALSSDGTRIVIGAPFNDGNGNNNGHVRVFEESGGTWSQIGSDINGASGSGQVQEGFSVSISANGSRIATGSPFADIGVANSGRVRVFEESSGTWTQVGGDILGASVNERSGFSISLSADGTRVAIGAPLNGDSFSLAGEVRVFQESGGTWTQLGGDINGIVESEQSARAVALSGDGSRLAIGAIGSGAGGGVNENGQVRVFEESGGTWSQVGSSITGEAVNDRFGASVALSQDGSRLIAGAPLNDGTAASAGHARVFEEAGGIWTQVGTDIEAETGGDNFGTAVAISNDGLRIAVGAPFNDGTGNNAGHVRVFQEDAGDWVQAGIDIDGETSEDESGTSISISGDGLRIAIGAPLNDNPGGFNSGHVRVYEDFLILPIELLSFQAQLKNQGIEIIWKTAQEENNHGFELERSDNGTEWQTIHFEQAKGNTSVNNYSFLDTQPKEGLNYYRLKQIDMNGQHVYYDIVLAEFLSPKTARLFYKNPSSRQVQFQLINSKMQDFQLNIFTPTGQVIWQSPRIKTSNSWSKTIELGTGIYFLSWAQGNKVFSDKLIVH
ncbi:MAG: T9SS type A sorting domain-containing protein [Saprospiraceae bacterium]|nr:T9SS type A sorting domain-containing protein [Saprospiraceae bacterium]